MKMSEKITKINELYKGDELIIEMLNDTISLAAGYVEIVTNMETKIQTLRFRLEGYDFRMRVQELDEQRRRKHNALIASLRSFDRLMIAEGNEDLKLFDGDIEDRYAIGNWAGQTVNEIFCNRRA